MPKTKTHTVSVELLRPAQPPTPPPQTGELLEKLIRQQVAEILAQRDTFMFEPFFRSRQVAFEIRRLQTVPEQRKWRIYFDRFGCLYCHIKRAHHASQGMCERCHLRVHRRLQTIIRELANKATDSEPFVADQEQIARQVLYSLAKAVPTGPGGRLLQSGTERGRK